MAAWTAAPAVVAAAWTLVALTRFDTGGHAEHIDDVADARRLAWSGIRDAYIAGLSRLPDGDPHRGVMVRAARLCADLGGFSPLPLRGGREAPGQAAAGALPHRRG